MSICFHSFFFINGSALPEADWQVLLDTPFYLSVPFWFVYVQNKLSWYTWEKWWWIGGEAPGFNATVPQGTVRKHVQPDHILPSWLCYKYFNYNLTSIYKSKHNLKSNFQTISSLSLNAIISLLCSSTVQCLQLHFNQSPSGIFHSYETFYRIQWIHSEMPSLCISVLHLSHSLLQLHSSSYRIQL